MPPIPTLLLVVPLPLYLVRLVNAQQILLLLFVALITTGLVANRIQLRNVMLAMLFPARLDVHASSSQTRALLIPSQHQAALLQMHAHTKLQLLMAHQLETTHHMEYGHLSKSMHRADFVLLLVPTNAKRLIDFSVNHHRQINISFLTQVVPLLALLLLHE